jgi:hypothetical protein
MQHRGFLRAPLRAQSPPDFDGLIAPAADENDPGLLVHVEGGFDVRAGLMSQAAVAAAVELAEAICGTLRLSGDSIGGHAAALKSLWLLAYREAQVQAFADADLAIAACFALSVLMVPFMHRVTPPGGPARSKWSVAELELS